METVSVKFEENLSHEVERVMKKHCYATKAEFIREAIRDKIQNLEKRDALKRLEQVFGAGAMKKTSDVALKKAREEIMKELLSQ